MNNHLPPQCLDSEMAILGGILIDNEAINTVLDLIEQDDFYREAHRKIFSSMVDLMEIGEPIDFILLSSALKTSGCLDEVGGAAYLLLLADHVPTSANIAYYCKIIKEKSLARRLLSQAKTTEGQVYSGESADIIIEGIETALVSLSSPKKDDLVFAPQLIKESVKRLQTRYKNKGELQGMSWGIEELDRATTGMQKKDLIVIAGRPSMGKSVLLGNISRALCLQKLSAAIFSLEMPKVDFTDRMIADLGNIKYHHLRTGQLADYEWSSNARACAEISQWRFAIDDTPAVTLRYIKSKAKKLKKNGLDLIGVDYLQLMGVSAKENRTQALGEISRGLKQLAKELDIAVVLLSQLNRTVDSRPDKRPLMSDLRDSGEIEQDADVIIFPFRPAAYCQKCRDRVDDDSHNLKEHQALAEIIIEKQRNGERNISIPAAWLGMYQRFEGL